MINQQQNSTWSEIDNTETRVEAKRILISDKESGMNISNINKPQCALGQIIELIYKVPVGATQIHFFRYAEQAFEYILAIEQGPSKISIKIYTKEAPIPAHNRYWG